MASYWLCFRENISKRALFTANVVVVLSNMMTTHNFNALYVLVTDGSRYFAQRNKRICRIMKDFLVKAKISEGYRFMRYQMHLAHGLPFCHALTDCDTVSVFRGESKRGKSFMIRYALYTMHDHLDVLLFLICMFEQRCPGWWNGIILALLPGKHFKTK
jgi:hypothetical protein